jgi:ABC-type branched-subunit amino acid transport system ATPase component/ABC-type branched-subunit amino acid transport system permease subunit
VVVFAIACMALNVLVGYTGLVSFGHGAWFGLAAYAAALAQLHLFARVPDSSHAALLTVFGPALLAALFIACLSCAFGFLILRRRGVYFSLLTLALAAMLYAVAFRWTAVTGGENGLGGIVRPVLFGYDLEDKFNFYVVVALAGFLSTCLLWRFHRSALGSVLVAVRENEERASFIGYQTLHYKLVAFVISATLTGLAGVLLLFNNRMTSAEPISVVFSGELLAMVVIGGMRSFLGPALGALFFVIFRDLLSSVTENWLLYFGLLFVFFVLFSPQGLVGVYQRISAVWRKTPLSDAAMTNRQAGSTQLPDFVVNQDSSVSPILKVEGLQRYFGGIRAVDGVSLEIAGRGLHALIGPNGAGKTTVFNLVSGKYLADKGRIELGGVNIGGLAPARRTTAGVGRSFQITNLFGGLSVAENVRLALQARSPARFNPWSAISSLDSVNQQTVELLRSMGLEGLERAEASSLSYGGQRLLDVAVAVGTCPRLLLLDEPLAGLASAERERVAQLVKTVSRDVPVLLVEHDIDRVFALADVVTVMNEGRVLTQGTAQDARDSLEVQAVYIGSGVHALAASSRASAARDVTLLRLDQVNTFYGKSHILRNLSFEVREGEILALLGRNGAGKSTLLKTLVGITPPSSGDITLGNASLARRPSSEITRLGLSYVPQGRGLFAGMTVAENMELGRLKRRNSAGVFWDDERIFSLFPRIKERWHSPADYLSGGEQQMVAVARALSGDTRLLLLDEPFEGLAPAVVEELFEAFDRLRHEVSILIVDHHLDLALALSDRTVVLERGEVTYTGASRELSQDLGLRRKVLWL